jgi:hypothetical protein
MKSRDTWLLVAAAAGLVVLGGAGVSLLGNLSPGQIATYAQNAGFSGSNLVTAVSIALAESGGNPNALGDTTIPQGPSYGLWQIDAYYHPEYGPDFTILYDPQTNANAAYAISHNGTNFGAWSTYPVISSTFTAQVKSALGVS